MYTVQTRMHLKSCTPGQDWAKWYVLHGVSIPELKMSTNLKLHLKTSVQMYCQMLHLAVHCSWYTL